MKDPTALPIFGIFQPFESLDKNSKHNGPILRHVKRNKGIRRKSPKHDENRLGLALFSRRIYGHSTLFHKRDLFTGFRI